MLPRQLMLTIKNRVLGFLGAPPGAPFLAWTLAGFASALFLTGCMPPGPRALLDGKRLIAQGDYAQALDRLKLAVSLLSSNALAWEYYGLACQYSGDAASAQKAYQRSLALDRNLTAVHYNLGCLWLEHNRPDAAKVELAAYVLGSSDSADGFAKLGQAQLELHELPAAEGSFNEALRLNPHDAEALNGLGLARLQRGQATEAAQYFARAAAEKPASRAALLNLAIVEDRCLKDDKAALQTFQNYLALKPAPPNAPLVAQVAQRLEQELQPPPPHQPPARTAQLATRTSPPAKAEIPVHPAPPAAKPSEPGPHPRERIEHAPAKNRASAPTVAAIHEPRHQRRFRPPPAPAPPSRPPETASAPAPGRFEAVKLRAEPDLRPARQSSPRIVGPAQVASATPLVSTSSLPSSITRTEPAPAPRQGFLQRFNPLNLLHGQRKHSTQPPQALTRIELYKAQTSTSTGAPSNQRNQPETTTPRYTYRSPPKPSPGNRPNAEVAFRRGLQAQEAKNLSEAVKDYYQAIRVDPSYFAAYYNLGLAFTSAHNLRAALTAYEYAMALKPLSEKARYNFALVLKQANYLTDAANQLEKILAADPNDVRAHLALGNLYAQEMHQPAQARQHYLQVLKLDPANPRAEAIRYWLAANP
jgi:tetratricopeptide (TPR) repeat protein